MNQWTVPLAGFHLGIKAGGGGGGGGGSCPMMHGIII